MLIHRNEINKKIMEEMENKIKNLRGVMVETMSVLGCSRIGKMSVESKEYLTK